MRTGVQQTLFDELMPYAPSLVPDDAFHIRADPRSRGVTFWKEYHNCGLNQFCGHFSSRLIFPAPAFGAASALLWRHPEPRPLGKLANLDAVSTSELPDIYLLSPRLLFWHRHDFGFFHARTASLLHDIALFIARAKSTPGMIPNGNDFFTDMFLDLADPTVVPDNEDFADFRALHARLTAPQCTLDDLADWLERDGVIIWACRKVLLRRFAHFSRLLQVEFPGWGQSAGPFLNISDNQFSIREAISSQTYHFLLDPDIGDDETEEEAKDRYARFERDFYINSRILRDLWLHRFGALVDTGLGLIIGNPKEIAAASEDLILDAFSSIMLEKYLEAVSPLH